MFEKLIESTTNAKENKKQSAYFGLTTVVYAALLTVIMAWSVFSFDLSDLNGGSDLTLESLVAPAVQVEPAIPQPRVNSEPKTNSQKNISKNYDELHNPVVNIKNATKPPDGIVTNKVNVDEIRDGVRFIVSDTTKRTEFSGISDARSNYNPPTFESVKPKSNNDETEVPPPPVVKKPETPPAEKKQTIVSRGVVNGEAVRLPKPAYPAAARAINVSGSVSVQVLIDEQGTVVSAVAASGHPLLRAAAVAAAKQAKFTPTKLSDQPVKVTGVIVYNFVP